MPIAEKTRTQSSAQKAPTTWLEEQKLLWAEIRLQRSLLFSSPLYHVQMISSFWKIDEDEPFYGYWIYDTASCNFATTGSTPDKAEFRKGFVINHGGHHSQRGVYVGTTFKQLLEVKATMQIDVDDQALRRLVQLGETAYFVRPDFPQPCPVYQLAGEELVDEARAAGYTTELEKPKNPEHMYRKVVEGDLLVLLPAGHNWITPLRIFPADWLPEDRYRRV
jgi:hypothetical protein